MRTPVSGRGGDRHDLGHDARAAPRAPDHRLIRRSASPGSSDMARKIPMSEQGEDRRDHGDGERAGP